MGLNIIWLALNLCALSAVYCIDGYATGSLDSFLQDSAFETLVRQRPHTGALYQGLLPANLSGVEVSIVRIRSRTLWKLGANFRNFQIPSRTKTIPHVKRLAIVYQDLGNWSSVYYTVPGYSIITSVVGFMVFNASNPKAKTTNNVSLDTKGRSIVIRFADSVVPERISEGAKCVAFNTNGTFFLSEIHRPSACYSHNQGHFSLVVPLASKQEATTRRRLWYLWVLGFVLGFGGMILAGYSVMVFLKLVKSKKIQVMERHADEDLVLETIWVGGSKMPSATVTRTQPILENGTVS